jgi:hypothetical protein
MTFLPDAVLAARAANGRRTGEPMQTVRSNDGTKIAYDRYGEGPAVILVAGAMTGSCRRRITPSGSTSWSPRATAVARPSTS